MYKFLVIFTVFILLFLCIFYQVKDISEYYILFKYFIYLIFFFGIPGFFLSADISVRSIEEKILVSFLTGIVSVSVVTFTFCAYFNEKVTIGEIFIISLFLITLGMLKNKNNLFSYLKETSKYFDKINFFELLYLFLMLFIIWTAYNISYDPNTVFIPSIERWTKADSTSCWVYCTLVMTDYSEALKTYEYNDIKTIFDFPPWITLGNVAFSSIFLELFQMSSWRFLYLMQGIFIGAFIYFIFLRMKIKFHISMLVSLLCSCNPFFLNMKTPDRNVIALMLCIFLYYILITTKNNYILKGFLTGVLISVGLRHITIIPAIAFFYLFFFYRQRIHIKMKKFLLYFIFLLFPLLTSISHFKSGFNGAPFIEKHNLFGLFSFYYKGLLNFPFIPKMVRAPFHVFPPFLDSIMFLLRQSGYILASICIAGAYYLFRKDKKMFSSMLFIFFIIAAILQVQADWLNYDKFYPSVTFFISLIIFFMFGIVLLINNYKKGIIAIISGFLILFIWISIIKNMYFPIDRRIYKYYEMNIETKEEYKEAKKELCSIPFFPDLSQFMLYYNIKNDYFYELKYNNIKDFLKNRKFLIGHDICSLVSGYYERMINKDDLKIKKLISFNIGKPVFSANILNLFKIMNTGSKNNCFFINKNDDINLNINNLNEEIYVKRKDNKMLLSFYFYKLRNINKKVYNIDNILVDSSFFIHDETDIKLGFKYYQNSYFSINKDNNFRFKYGKLNGIYHISGQSWLFKVCNDKIESVFYGDDTICRNIEN